MRWTRIFQRDLSSKAPQSRGAHYFGTLLSDLW